MNDRSGFSDENRVRLIYVLDDLLEKPRPRGFGEYSGGEEFRELDEMLRRRLGKLNLGAYEEHEYFVISKFIQVASEDELLDLIELTPRARLRGVEKRVGQYGSHRVTADEVNFIFARLDSFLEGIGSRARFDRKTGKLNRDGFEIEKAGPLAGLPKLPELEADVSALLSNHELFSCILLDLDHFKAVNDRHGHPAGDACLQEAVNAISEVIAKKGKLYRFREGDEFAIILRNATTAEAQATAERIRTEIEIRNPGKDVPVTASVGVVSSYEGFDSREKLLDAADEAMYVSKHKGRNRVTASPVPSDDLASARTARAKATGRIA
jgi:diguanylate cyclase (GGDEF)-like protein